MSRPGRYPGLLDRLEDRLEGGFVGRQVGRETALVAYAGAVALRFQHCLERVEDLHAVPQGFAEARGADRQDHELLQIDVVVGVRAAVHDVHHRDREPRRAVAREMAVERRAGVLRGGMRRGKRHRQQGVGAEPRLGRRPVRLDHRAVDPPLVGRVGADEQLAQLAIDVANCAGHALAAVALWVLVPQLHRLARARRRARRHRGEAAHAARKRHRRGDGRVAARIEDLVTTHVLDRPHGHLATSTPRSR